MNKLSKIRAVAVAIVMGLPLLAVNLAATAASAAVTPDLHVVCNLGQTRITWSQVSKPWVVTHATQYSNWQSKTSTATRSTTNVRQVTASASVTTGVTVSESTLIESLQPRPRCLPHHPVPRPSARVA